VLRGRLEASFSSLTGLPPTLVGEWKEDARNSEDYLVVSNSTALLVKQALAKVGM
jgi:hypothetical protein